MRGTGLGRSTAQVFERLARFEQPPLRDGQLLVGRTLILVEPRDRRARFVLAPLEHVALVLSLPPFERQLLALADDPRRFVRRALQLRFDPDDHLLLPMLFGAERRDRARRLRDDAFEGAGFFGEAVQGFTLPVDPGAEIADLAPGFEDAPGLLRIATGHQLRAPEQLA